MALDRLSATMGERWPHGVRLALADFPSGPRSPRRGNITVTSYIRNVMLHTGAERNSALADLDPGTVATFREFIAAIAETDHATHWRMRHLIPDFSVAGESHGRCIAGGFLVRNQLVALISAAAHRRCGSETWRSLHEHAQGWRAVTDPDRQPPTPWVGMLAGPAWDSVVGRDPIKSALWSGLASCFGWAWLKHLEDRQ